RSRPLSRLHRVAATSIFYRATRTLKILSREIRLRAVAHVKSSFSPDPFNFFLDRQFIEARQWQAQEKPDPPVECDKRIPECPVEFLPVFSRISRVRNAPVRSHRLPWPPRASLARGAVAQREHKIHLWRAPFGKLVPALAPQPFDRHLRPLKLAQRQRMNLPVRLAPRAISSEVRPSFMSQNPFRQDRPRPVPRTQKQYVIVSLHGLDSSISQSPSVSVACSCSFFSPHQCLFVFICGSTGFFALMNALANFPFTCGAIASTSTP